MQEVFLEVQRSVRTIAHIDMAEVERVIFHFIIFGGVIFAKEKNFESWNVMLR